MYRQLVNQSLYVYQCGDGYSTSRSEVKEVIESDSDQEDNLEDNGKSKGAGVHEDTCGKSEGMGTPVVSQKDYEQIIGYVLAIIQSPGYYLPQ